MNKLAFYCHRQFAGVVEAEVSLLPELLSATEYHAYADARMRELAKAWAQPMWGVVAPGMNDILEHGEFLEGE